MAGEDKDAENKSGTESGENKDADKDAELDELRQIAKQHKAMMADIEDLGFEDADDFIDVATEAMSTVARMAKERQQAKEKSGEDKEGGDKGGNGKDKESSPPSPTIDTEQLSRAEEMAREALLTAQWNEFDRVRSSQKKEDQTEYTRKDLEKLFKEEMGVVLRLAAKKFNNNVFQSAEYIKMMEEGPGKFKEQGKKQEAARNKEKESLKAETGLNQDDGKDDDKRTDMQKAADEIAPDDTYYYPGN